MRKILHEDYTSPIYKDGTGRYTEGFGTYKNDPVEYTTVTVKSPAGAIKQDPIDLNYTINTDHENINNIDNKYIENINNTVLPKEKNEGGRRIPTGAGVMEDKKFNDVVYAYLQSISYKTSPNKPRFLYENQLNYTRIAKELKMNLKTLKSKIKYLFDNGYIVKAKENDLIIYKLPDLKDYYFIIPNKTLKYMLDVVNENVIMTYSYLGQLKKSMGDRAYFTKNKLLMLLGYKTKAKVNGEVIERASTHKRDWERINNILDMLQDKLKLIEIIQKKEYVGSNSITKYYYKINTEIETKEG